MVALGLLTDSVSFIDDLANWKTTAYQDLIADTFLPPEKIWNMILECEAKIWEEIADARSPYVDAARHAPGYYMYGMLRAEEVQNRYLENDFQDDPGLMGIFTRQILFHGQDMSLKSTLDSLADKQSKADTKIQTNAGEIKLHAKKIKDLETDVKKLKGKS